MAAEDEWESDQNETEVLLFRIDKLVKKANIGIAKVRMILAASGPGQYTTLRIGVATANALAFSLNIPVNQLKEGEDLKTVIKSYGSSHSDVFDKPVKPKYLRPPHITKKRG